MATAVSIATAACIATDLHIFIVTTLTDPNYKINHLACKGWKDYHKCDFLWETYLFEGVTNLKMYSMVTHGAENGLIDVILMINILQKKSTCSFFVNKFKTWVSCRIQ